MIHFKLSLLGLLGLIIWFGASAVCLSALAKQMLLLAYLSGIAVLVGFICVLFGVIVEYVDV